MNKESNVFQFRLKPKDGDIINVLQYNETLELNNNQHNIIINTSGNITVNNIKSKLERSLIKNEEVGLEFFSNLILDDFSHFLSL